MDDSSIKSILRQMKLGETWDERHFIRKGMSVSELSSLVSQGYLLRDDKSASDFLSDNKYTITESGREFAWNENRNS